MCQSSKFYPETKVKNEKLSIVNFSNSCENMGVKSVETIVESKWQSEGRGARYCIVESSAVEKKISYTFKA